MGISNTTAERIADHTEAILQAANALTEAVNAANFDGVRVRFAKGPDQPGAYHHAPTVTEIAHVKYVAPKPTLPAPPVSST